MNLNVTLANRTHGRISTYSVGCRCADCTEAKRVYARNNVKHRAYERARTLAVSWMTANEPAVWRALVDQAISEIEANR